MFDCAANEDGSDGPLTPPATPAKSDANNQVDVNENDESLVVTAVVKRVTFAVDPPEVAAQVYDPTDPREATPTLPDNEVKLDLVRVTLGELIVSHSAFVFVLFIAIVVNLISIDSPF